MSTWLVTGGAGFIGSNFVRTAAERTSAKLVILDALTYAGNLANIADLIDEQRIVFVHGDICDADLVAETFARHRVDTVVHFAAESHVDRSILGPRAFLTTNIDGTYTLLEAARQAWTDAGGARFLHVSTDEVYGELNETDPPFTEATAYRPNSPYSASKAASDHLVRAWRRTYGLPTIVTNCSNNYGPWQFPEKLIPLMTLNALEGRELPIYGDGRQIRDWIHVLDHCEALLTILHRGAAGETYLIGSNEEWANVDLVTALCDAVDELLDKPSGTSRQLMRTVPDRPGHDRRYAMDATKVRTELGWRPVRTLRHSLPEVVRWYQEHGAWADAIRTGEYRAFYERQYAAHARRSS